MCQWKMLCYVGAASIACLTGLRYVEDRVTLAGGSTRAVITRQRPTASESPDRKALAAYREVRVRHEAYLSRLGAACFRTEMIALTYRELAVDVTKLTVEGCSERVSKHLWRSARVYDQVADVYSAGGLACFDRAAVMLAILNSSTDELEAELD